MLQSLVLVLMGLLMGCAPGASVGAAGSAAPVYGWHAAALVTLQGQTRDTHQLLFGVGDQFVKVRVSFAPGTVTDAELRQFAQALMEQLVAR